jgi:hypothetical protein
VVWCGSIGLLFMNEQISVGTLVGTNVQVCHLRYQDSEAGGGGGSIGSGHAPDLILTVFFWKCIG